MEARHDLETRWFLAERENMQYRWSSNSSATTDPHRKFEEVAMRRKCPGNIPQPAAEMLFWLSLACCIKGESNWVSLVCVRQNRNNNGDSGHILVPLPIPVRSAVASFSVHFYVSFLWSLMAVRCCDPSPNVLGSCLVRGPASILLGITISICQMFFPCLIV